MFGTLVNVAAIIAGGLLGLILKGGIPKKVGDTVIQALALSVLLIGITGAIKVNNILLVIISMVIGTAIGEAIDIDKYINKLGDMLEKKFKGKGGKVSEGFVTSSLLFCVGAMAIVGALNSGLKGDYHILYAKSMLDFVFSVIASSSLGIGVMLSSVSVLIYQGTITLLAFAIKGFLIESVITDMTAVGSLMIIGISLNMLGVSKLKVANFLPAILIPVFYQIILTVIK
ncbi:MAG: DUF554 domain-containing protein [Solirubrobacterales bacterium]